MNTVTITVDTNVLPMNDLLTAAAAPGYEFAVVTVTERELNTMPYFSAPSEVRRIPETMVWGESKWGQGIYGGKSDSECFEKVLSIISAGSFPSKTKRENLTSGQSRQLRDAMIFCVHIRERRDIFITNDEKGFVREGRRERLQADFATRIMTREEFLQEVSGK